MRRPVELHEGLLLSMQPAPREPAHWVCQESAWVGSGASGMAFVGRVNSKPGSPLLAGLRKTDSTPRETARQRP